ncbi:hypothetical protein IDM40_18560 [Nocardiopsis sp. HNM0947]|uniref:PEP-utilising enzyme mobile domain-containing protein n=1 Tax=Nocardiopsis coralli TaxID=2772213 RepID=A0ABR9PA18_9ACTN|nr:PEP-utilizing enzyme [Nocardiopsis coralli]MBE3000687.1 hypothetical protein [Nocardiopsis coralli]
MDALTEEWIGAYMKDRRTGGAVRLITGVGGRLYIDMTDFLRNKRMRPRLPSMADVYGPRAKAAIQHLLEDPRFAPVRGMPFGFGPTVAREYGIPAVICLRDATRRIQDGDLITVDGAAGTVTPMDDGFDAHGAAGRESECADPG